MSQDDVLRRNAAVAFQAWKEQEAAAVSEEDRKAAEDEAEKTEASRRAYIESVATQLQWLRRCLERDDERMENLRNQEVLNRRHVEASERMASALEKLVVDDSARLKRCLYRFLEWQAGVQELLPDGLYEEATAALGVVKP